jgi:hypothetical protein
VGKERTVTARERLLAELVTNGEVLIDDGGEPIGERACLTCGFPMSEDPPRLEHTVCERRREVGS